MATYAPPTSSLTLFNPDVFLTPDNGDFLTFPVAQGSETFPFGLTASSMTTTDPTTIDTLVMSDLNPQYKIDYPVNSGRIDFYANTGGGTSTRGLKVDATGVHTISKYDTIDETAGQLDIGVLATRTGAINIGTGNTSSKTVSVGGTNTTVALVGSTITASRMAVANNLSGGISTFTSVASNTYTGTSMTITPVTQLAIGGTTASNSPFFNQVGGTTSINGGNATQGIDIGHGQTSGVINFGNISTRTGAINLGYSGSTTTLNTNATTINLGDANTTGGIIAGVPFRPNYDSGTFGYTSAMMGYQTTQTPTTVAIATGTSTNLTNAFTLGNGVWMIVLRVLVNASASTASAWYRVGLSKTSATFENDRTVDFSPNATGDNYFVCTLIVQSSTATNWYVIGQQVGVTTTIANTNIRVQQTRIA